MNLIRWDYFIADLDETNGKQGMSWDDRELKVDKAAKELHDLMYSQFWDDVWMDEE